MTVLNWPAFFILEGVGIHPPEQFPAALTFIHEPDADALTAKLHAWW